MDEEIRLFTGYLEEIKKLSRNTVMSYHGDLTKMAVYMKEQGITSTADIRGTTLNAYVLHMEKNGMSAATISRYIASMKAFFEYLVRERILDEDPSFFLKPPKVEKKLPGILTVEEMEHLLEQPSGDNPKGMRDKAMLELLYATGMRVSELVHLEVEDVNLRFGCIICRENGKERMIPFGGTAGKALQMYLDKGRNTFLKNEEDHLLFFNCSGAPMSRQGFWKVLKGYASRAGIEKDITPRMFRHSCAAHMAAGGAGLQIIREMLGHTDMAATQIYAEFQPGITTEYRKAHPRG